MMMISRLMLLMRLTLLPDSLDSFVLLEHIAMLLTSTLAINC